MSAASLGWLVMLYTIALSTDPSETASCEYVASLNLVAGVVVKIKPDRIVNWAKWTNVLNPPRFKCCWLLFLTNIHLKLLSIKIMKKLNYCTKTVWEWRQSLLGCM